MKPLAIPRRSKSMINMERKESRDTIKAKTRMVTVVTMGMMICSISSLEASREVKVDNSSSTLTLEVVVTNSNSSNRERICSITAM